MIHPDAIAMVRSAACDSRLQAEQPWLAAALFEAVHTMVLSNEFFLRHCQDIEPGSAAPMEWGSWQTWMRLLQVARDAAWKAWQVGNQT